ncbi:MAG: preprotein translocase subunit SecA [Rhodospirillaceae bacterium]|nr:preprotein translocase subunit SecA [Rhodospirillaceae bacterium]|tara:strand:+ start:12873 stop:15515 length:2643 start_codon:yes stop_codon:yes gene_type:complete
MITNFAKKIFGTSNDRIIRDIQGIVDNINKIESGIQKLSDEEIKSKTLEFKKRLSNGSKLDDLLVEAYAVVREASKRTLNERHYDVQLLGGIVLHKGNIAEMKTGEGKTLVSTLAVYLNSLSGKGVHVVTVNDYLAKRDSEWMGEIYNFLGLSVGCITPGIEDDQRRQQYLCDVTYSTNNELGFDYLRDNMKYDLESMVQRPFNYAIIDEVDSILIDEARTPLIISGPGEQSSDLYKALNKLIPELNDQDYEKDEKTKSINLTDSGVETLETLLAKAGLLKGESLYDIDNVSIVHHANQALRAHQMFQKDRDYIVKNDNVVIIDEFTGRALEGRRYSEGLHQALESKEKVTIQQENQTLASITFQNYFRMYPKLAGMTGTAITEAEEFNDIYNLNVVEMPTNKPIIRVDEDDEIYRTNNEKINAIIKNIKECINSGQPVLVGTVSIEKSEELSKILKKNKINHRVLNARYHAQEAQIIAQAGRVQAVTIATNMAGRGTDIKLGGNSEMIIDEQIKNNKNKVSLDKNKIKRDFETEKEKVIDLGGLAIIATERHESRRIDNQLRGRAGRQGDPGKSNFYLSLEDDLMRIFGSERMDGMLKKLGLKDNEAIVHPWVNKAIQKAQQKVEARNYDIRKNLLKFDDVMNDQRKVIYEQRREIMKADNVSEIVGDMREEVLDGVIDKHIPEKAFAEEWKISELSTEIKKIFGVDLPIIDWAKEEGIAEKEIRERVKDHSDRYMLQKIDKYGKEVWNMVEKNLTLQVLDQHWKDHLLGLDHLRQGIGLRAYGQKDPLNEYKSEAFGMFENMLSSLRESLVMFLSNIEINLETISEQTKTTQERTDETYSNQQKLSQKDENKNWGKVGRNAPCPCGSGKKYKHCCGKI